MMEIMGEASLMIHNGIMRENREMVGSQWRRPHHQPSSAKA